VLASLALVLLTAAVVVAGLVLQTQRTQIDALERLAARTLADDANRPLPLTTAAVPRLRWWRLPDAGGAQPLGGHGEPLDARSLELAVEARRQGRLLVRSGLPWEPTRFAVPRNGEVRIARLPPAASGGWLLGLVLIEASVFTAFGVVLLRRRLVDPLLRLRATARAIADGDLSARALADGPRETYEVATAFNEMSEALESRTDALEKAVSDLRESNRELQQAREGMDRAGRLAAVGKLAAGVAHEVGNPMGAVLAFLDLVRRDPELSDASREHLERAAQEGGRVRTILRQLLDFSRPPRVTTSPVNLLRVAERTLELVRAQRRYADVRFEIRGQPAAPLALADSDRVAQILLNLLLNAADAALEGDSPAVSVEVRGVPGALRQADLAGAAASPPAFDAVECRVRDSGPGVAAEDRERVFDPFFSNKPPGQGTGLGLPNALRMAEQLGGSVELTRSDGVGAEFVLRLTLADG